MIKTILIAFSFLFIGSPATNNDAYTLAVETGLSQQDEADSFETYEENAGYFEQLMNEHPSKWEPAFHAAFSYIRMTFKQKGLCDAQDAYLERSKTLLEEAKSRGMNDESEYLALLAYWYQAHISVSPKIRGMRNASKTTNLMEEAMELNPANPRPYLLMGMQLIFTPRVLGGGEKKGCGYLKTAKEKYENFQLSSSIAPNWGYDDIERYWPKCEE